jgi:hypothetical protein
LLTRALFFALFAVVCGCLALTKHEGPWPCADANDCEPQQQCVHLYALQGQYCAFPGDCTTTDDCSLWGLGVLICTNGRCAARACTGDSDCYGNVRCEDRTCATECATKADCTAEHVCAAPNCVDGCESDSDCLAGHLCVSGRCSDCSLSYVTCPGIACSGGSCVRCDGGACDGGTATGKDAAADAGDGGSKPCDDAGHCGTCQGTAVECASQFNCGSVPGCQVAQSCTGTAVPCSALSYDVCIATSGCTTQGGGSTVCSGSTQCAWQLSWGANCTNVPGCSLNSTCTGTPSSCTSLSQTECIAVQGCTLQ